MRSRQCAACSRWLRAFMTHPAVSVQQEGRQRCPGEAESAYPGLPLSAAVGLHCHLTARAWFHMTKADMRNDAPKFAAGAGMAARDGGPWTGSEARWSLSLMRSLHDIALLLPHENPKEMKGYNFHHDTECGICDQTK